MATKHELVRLATWGPTALSAALADVKTALIADGIDPIKQLKVSNLFGWCLQADPSKRAQSCAEMLKHSVFIEDNEGVEEEKTYERDEVTQEQVLSLSTELELTTSFHIASELGASFKC